MEYFTADIIYCQDSDFRRPKGGRLFHRNTPQTYMKSADTPGFVNFFTFNIPDPNNNKRDAKHYSN